MSYSVETAIGYVQPDREQAAVGANLRPYPKVSL
jgi:hypothetical protein